MTSHGRGVTVSVRTLLRRNVDARSVYDLTCEQVMINVTLVSSNFCDVQNGKVQRLFIVSRTRTSAIGFNAIKTTLVIMTTNPMKGDDKPAIDILAW